MFDAMLPNDITIDNLPSILHNQLSHYEQYAKDSLISFDDAKRHATTAMLFVTGTREILRDLNYKEDVFEKLLSDLDDSYDYLKAYSLTDNGTKLKDMIDRLLTQMVKLQDEISTLIVEHKHDNRV